MSEDYSAGVKMLLQRMETNPQEFISSEGRIGSKWGEMVEGILDAQGGKVRGLLACLTAEELAALFTAYAKISRKEFDSIVMRRLLVDDFYTPITANKARQDKIYMRGAGRVGQVNTGAGFQQAISVEQEQEEYSQQLQELQRLRGMK